MNRQTDPPMDREAQALDAYMDWIADHPGQTPPPPADEIQAFAAAIQQSVPPLTPEDLANDPILASLRANQQEYVQEQSRQLIAQSGDERLRRTTVESGRAAVSADSVQAESAASVAGAGGAATARRMPGFSYMTAIVLLGLVTLTLFAITISSRDGFRTPGSGGDDPKATVTIGISNQDPSVVVDGVEMQILDWDVRELVGNGDSQESPHRGAFVVLELVVVKANGEPGPVPYHGLLIKDDQGRLFTIDVPATEANQAIEGGMSVATGDLIGSTPQTVILVFDVPVNSETYQMTNIEETFSLPLSEP